MQQKHFYQKFGTWASLSFLTGATVMVVAFALFDSTAVPGATTGRVAYTQPGLSSRQSQADFGTTAPGQGVQVAIAQPAEGEQISPSGVLGISVAAGAAGGVKDIAVWIDGQLAKSCAGSRCILSISAQSLNGQPTHTIQAQATGLDGQTGSAIRHFSVVLY